MKKLDELIKNKWAQKTNAIIYYLQKVYTKSWLRLTAPAPNLNPEEKRTKPVFVWEYNDKKDTE